MSRFTEKVGGGSGEGSLVFVKPADLSRAGFTGVIAEGTFLEALPNRFSEDTFDFKLKVDVDLEVEGKNKDGAAYKTAIGAGDTLIVNGAGNLNYLMKNIAPGELCQITYLGKKEIAKGDRKGTLAHTFEVMK